MKLPYKSSAAMSPLGLFRRGTLLAPSLSLKYATRE